MKNYRGEDWEQARRAALERDRYMCQYLKCINQATAVHHIIPYSKTKDNRLSNLISLCNKHHKHEDNHYVQFKQVSMTLRKIQNERLNNEPER